MLDVSKLTEQLLGPVARGTKIDHLPGDHDDRANAAAGALRLAQAVASCLAGRDPLASGCEVCYSAILDAELFQSIMAGEHPPSNVKAVASNRIPFITTIGGLEMENELINPIALGAEAILELEELKRGVRSAAPSLYKLFHFLRTPQPAFQGQGVSMLDDVRSYVLFRDSLAPTTPKIKDHPELKKAVEKYLRELEAGVNAGDKDMIADAKRFCLAFNENLLAKQMNDIYGRRERGESRYMGHESIL